MKKSATNDTRCNGWPVSGTALDALKIFAALFMLIDHTALSLLGEKFFFAQLIGRAAMPLFCYAVAAAIIRGAGKPMGNYLVWLLVFGVATQPFFAYALGNDHANVLFTLAAGAAIAANIHRISWPLRHAVFLFGLLDVAFKSAWDFGVTGALLPAVFVLMIRGEKQVWPWVFALLFALNYATEDMSLDAFAQKWPGYAVLLFFAGVLPWFVVRICRDLPERGRLMPRFFLYYFYPGHLLLLSVIKALGLQTLL